MIGVNGDGAQPLDVAPLRLTVLLEQAGWQLIGGRRAIYNRLSPPSDTSGGTRTLVVPLDRGAPEYEELMRKALAKIAGENFDTWRGRLLPRLSVAVTDEYRFRKESDAPSGLIVWREGEALIQAARATLVAGAKALLTKARHFGNKHGQFASRYLDAVLMGQTAPGSYVVTAYAPSETAIPVRQTSEHTIGLPGVDYVQGNEISASIVSALGATVEALDHFRSSQSFSGFDAGVERGVSYELANALVNLTTDAEEANIFVEWHPSGAGLTVSDIDFVFSGRDTPVLQRAATRLVSTEPQPRTVVIGRVHLLTKKDAGLPGVVGVEAVGSAIPKKVRVHLLQASDYHLAVRAHDEDLLVRVVGDLQREGTLNWLYSAHIEEVIGRAEGGSSATAMTGTPVLDFDTEDDAHEI
ncbi:hypothetical protein GCM10009558_002600 [Virgisporangium aurantiacum]